MTSSDLQQWQSDMGYTQQAAADALGVSLATYKDWLRGISRNSGKQVEIDRRTDLACKALAAGIS